MNRKELVNSERPYDRLLRECEEAMAAWRPSDSSWPTGGTAFIRHTRMGPTCNFGPFHNWDEVKAFLAKNPQVNLNIEWMFLDVDWARE